MDEACINFDTAGNYLMGDNAAFESGLGTWTQGIGLEAAATADPHCVGTSAIKLCDVAGREQRLRLFHNYKLPLPSPAPTMYVAKALVLVPETTTVVVMLGLNENNSFPAVHDGRWQQLSASLPGVPNLDLAIKITEGSSPGDCIYLDYVWLGAAP